MICQRGNMTELVRKRIADDIIGNVFSGEDKFVTAALAKRYQVSRTPVREALSQLEREGVIEAAPNTSYRLRRVSWEELLDLYEIRMNLESMAVRKLTQSHPSEALLKRLRVLEDTFREANFIEERRRSDREFHQLICENCGSVTLGSIIRNCQLITEVFALTINMTLEYCPDRSIKVRREHSDIVEAIASGDAKRAEKAVRQHVLAAIRIIERNLERTQRNITKGK